MPTRVIHVVLLCCSLCLFNADADAQGRFGFGCIVGEPTGLSWNYRMANMSAVDGAIGFSPYDRFRMHADYLWHSYPFSEQNLALHYGVGAALGFGRSDYLVIDRRTYILRREELGFGVRTVIGVTYLIPRSPVDLFLEVAPIFIMIPRPPGFGIDVGLGARVYP
jgi:hypothetical protein